MKFTFETIEEAEVETLSRGRQPSESALQLSEFFNSMSKGQVVRIVELTAETKEEKTTHGNVIRSGAKIAGRKVGIRWSPAGVPQITMKN